MEKAMHKTLKKIDSQNYHADPNRFLLVSGEVKGAPLCPYGNHYKWIGFDNGNQEYVRFTKSVYLKLLKNINHEMVDKH